MREAELNTSCWFLLLFFFFFCWWSGEVEEKWRRRITMNHVGCERSSTGDRASDVGYIQPGAGPITFWGLLELLFSFALLSCWWLVDWAQILDALFPVPSHPDLISHSDTATATARTREELGNLLLFLSSLLFFSRFWVGEGRGMSHTRIHTTVAVAALEYKVKRRKKKRGISFFSFFVFHLLLLLIPYGFALCLVSLVGGRRGMLSWRLIRMLQLTKNRALVSACLPCCLLLLSAVRVVDVPCQTTGSHASIPRPPSPSSLVIPLLCLNVPMQ